MATVSTHSFLKSRLYAKLRLYNEKLHFCHKTSFLKLRLFVKSRLVKSRLYCTVAIKDRLGTDMGMVGGGTPNMNFGQTRFMVGDTPKNFQIGAIKFSKKLAKIL